jgi:hypothetical protein
MATAIDQINYDERKSVYDSIKLLVKPEQENVFKIIKLGKETYSENSNGIFFDLTTITTETFYKIKEYLDFCLSNRRNDELRLKTLEQIRKENDIQDMLFNGTAT